MLHEKVLVMIFFLIILRLGDVNGNELLGISKSCSVALQ